VIIVIKIYYFYNLYVIIVASGEEMDNSTDMRKRFSQKNQKSVTTKKAQDKLKVNRFWI
jgi:hypothetical protein